MVDRETGTVWTHLDGKAIQGSLEGSRMTMIAVLQMTWGAWMQSYPETMVLSPDTPFNDLYQPVRIGIYNPREDQFGDDRLASNALVIGVEVDGQFKGYPVEELLGVGGVVNDKLSSQPLVVFYDSNAQTGLAYSRELNGRILTFHNAESQGLELRDRETNSLWDLQGGAISGPLAGESLTFVPSFISEWYGWSGYHPESQLYTAEP